MKKNGKHKRINSNDSKSHRRYYQFVLETIWAVAVSVMVGCWVP